MNSGWRNAVEKRIKWEFLFANSRLQIQMLQGQIKKSILGKQIRHKMDIVDSNKIFFIFTFYLLLTCVNISPVLLELPIFKSFRRLNKMLCGECFSQCLIGTEQQISGNIIYENDGKVCGIQYILAHFFYS